MYILYRSEMSFFLFIFNCRRINKTKKVETESNDREISAIKKKKSFFFALSSLPHETYREKISRFRRTTYIQSDSINFSSGTRQVVRGYRQNVVVVGGGSGFLVSCCRVRARIKWRVTACGEGSATVCRF